MPNIKHTVFYVESPAFQPCFLRKKKFEKIIIDDHFPLYKVLTVKNDDNQHFNNRRPSNPARLNSTNQFINSCLHRPIKVLSL